MQKTCPVCREIFTCKTEPGCWCADLPHFMPLPAGPATGCLCPTCLEEKLKAAEQQAPELGSTTK